MKKDIFHCFDTLANSLEQLKINESGKTNDGITYLIEYYIEWYIF